MPNGLLGFPTERFGGFADAAESFLDAANEGRYGMGERERSQLIGRLPGSPGYGPEGERYTSSFLFARKNPGLAHLFGPFANAVSDTMYGTNFADTAARGRQAGAQQRQNEFYGGPSLDEAVGNAQRQRNEAVTGPTANVDVSATDFHIPEFLAPSLPRAPGPVPAPALGPEPTPFDDGFDSFMNDRSSNTSGTAFDPFAGGDPYGDPTFGSVTPDGTPIEPAGMQPGQGNPDTGTAGGNLPDDFDPDGSTFFDDINAEENEDQTNFLQGGGPGEGSNQDKTQRQLRQDLANEYGQNAGIFMDLFLGGGGGQDKYIPLF